MRVRLSLLSASVLAFATVVSLPALAQDIDFGDDSGAFSRDGECDDPRFEGAGMAISPVEADSMADASDCSKAFRGGRITLIAGGDAPTGDGEPPQGDVDFGANSSDWANNGECDDPRFTGTGMAAVLLPEDRLADAADCRTLFDAGSITLAAGGDVPAPDAPDAPAGVDFGANTSDWANNGECDDPRFTGTGMAEILLPEDTLIDAADCQALFDAGSITLIAGHAPVTDAPGQTGAVDFGADSGQWTNDGECDDPRFVGQGMARTLVDADRFADATDCRTLYEAGSITLVNP